MSRDSKENELKTSKQIFVTTNLSMSMIHTHLQLSLGTITIKINRYLSLSYKSTNNFNFPKTLSLREKNLPFQTNFLIPPPNLSSKYLSTLTNNSQQLQLSKNPFSKKKKIFHSKLIFLFLLLISLPISNLRIIQE